MKFQEVAVERAGDCVRNLFWKTCFLLSARFLKIKFVATKRWAPPPKDCEVAEEEVVDEARTSGGPTSSPTEFSINAKRPSLCGWVTKLKHHVLH